MKKIILEFFRRGLMTFGFGPLVLAVLYLILQAQGLVGEITVKQMSIGIFSLSALAFVAGGMNVIYQIERLPLMVAILIHGGTLYVSYLLTYLINDWLKRGMIPILVFSGIFVVGYFAIWAVIYSVIRVRTARLNEMLSKQHQTDE